MQWIQLLLLRRPVGMSSYSEISRVPSSLEFFSEILCRMLLVKMEDQSVSCNGVTYCPGRLLLDFVLIVSSKGLLDLLLQVYHVLWGSVFCWFYLRGFVCVLFDFHCIWQSFLIYGGGSGYRGLLISLKGAFAFLFHSSFLEWFLREESLYILIPSS